MKKINQAFFASMALLAGAFLMPLAEAAPANDAYPFIGTKNFNFMGGNGTEESITIRKNGQTTIKLLGTTGTLTEYKGKFHNPITTKDGSGYQFKDGKVYSLDHGKPAKGCKGDPDSDCVSDLY